MSDESFKYKCSFFHILFFPCEIQIGGPKNICILVVPERVIDKINVKIIYKILVNNIHFP